MVADNINTNISFFLGRMHSPYLGNTNIINGHAIYNSLLKWTDVNAGDIEKVSFGISQNDPISLKGSNKYQLNVSETPKIEKPKRKIRDTVLDNLSKGYDAFKVLRGIENSLTNPNIDYSPIPFEIIKPKHGTLIAHKIDYFTFFIIWKNKIPDIDFTGTELTIGAGRNSGFGFTTVERVFNTTLSQILFGLPEEDKTYAMSGISGIYNHARYGFGEFIIDQSKTTKKKLVKLTTPLCMRTTYPEATQYGSLPSFITPTIYEKTDNFIYDKGTRHTLGCIQSGKTFELIC